MSYFEQYFNLNAERTLRSYSALLDISRFDRLDWTTEDGSVDVIIEALERRPHYQLMDNRAAAGLLPVDKLSFEAGFLGSNPEGLFAPKGKKLGRS